MTGADRGLCKTKEDAEAIVALTQLRRMYCEAIKEEEDIVYARNKGFTIQSGVWALTKSVFYGGILPFKSAENAWRFFNENRDLFEKIKILFV